MKRACKGGDTFIQHNEFPNPVNIIRYGANTALPTQHLLKAGPISAVLENSTLKYNRIVEQEVIRQIYAAVRNDSWGTVSPQFHNYSFDTDFHSRLTAKS